MIAEKRKSLIDDRQSIGKCSIGTLIYLAWRHNEYYVPQLPKQDKSYLKEIIKDIYTVFDVDAEYLSCAKKDRVRAIIRFIYCYVGRTKTKASYKEIGELIGNRDHATIIYAIREANQYIKDNQKQFMEYWNWYKNKSSIW